MPHPSVKPIHTFILVAVFLMGWVYTEVTEKLARDEREQKGDARYKEFRHFHDAGKRFTAEEGKEIKSQIVELQDQLNELQGKQRWEPTGD